MPSPPASRFTDPRTVSRLYAGENRLTRRTSALHAAKTRGHNVNTVIPELLGITQSDRAILADIGCGRGSTALHLAREFTAARVIALDRSSPLLHAAQNRGRRQQTVIEPVLADFHALPLLDGCLQAAVAAFCLYHSATPIRAVAEIRRCLAPGARAVLVTKSVDSYRALDRLVESSGLDPGAQQRPSLYATFHSTNAAAVTTAVFNVLNLIHDEHEFHFPSAELIATYLSTSAKYDMPRDLASDIPELAAALQPHIPVDGLTVTSTVTYVVAVAP
jgi:SAM-dependent methyltransferase